MHGLTSRSTHLSQVFNANDYTPLGAEPSGIESNVGIELSLYMREFLGYSLASESLLLLSCQANQQAVSWKCYL